MMMRSASSAIALESPVRVGFITDIHYADKPTTGTRHYRAGLAKLGQAIDVFNQWGVDLVYQNGDYVDQDGRTKSEVLVDLAAAEAVFATADAPRAYGFGNHCLDVLTKAEFIDQTGMQAGHYHRDVKGCRFIVLDPCFRSDNDSDPFSAGNFTWATSYIPPGQRAWLSALLDEFEGPVVIFCHYQLVGGGYAVSNAAAVRAIIEASPHVAAVFGGHAHTNSQTVSGGKPYYGMAAATEGALPANAFSVIEVRKSGVRVHGYGSQISA